MLAFRKCPVFLQPCCWSALFEKTVSETTGELTQWWKPPFFFLIFFSGNCFCLLLRVLLFSASMDIAYHLTKMRPITQVIQAKVSSLLVPYQDLCIDELMVPWRGRLSIRQWILCFGACATWTGYILIFTVYTGRTTSFTIMKKLRFPGFVVVELVANYFGKRCSLLVDN